MGWIVVEDRSSNAPLECLTFGGLLPHTSPVIRQDLQHAATN